MSREFLCCSCGLLFWEESPDYKEKFNYSYECPNCKINFDKNQSYIITDDGRPSVMACDTTGFAYFTYNHKEIFEEMKLWTTQEYSPDFALEVYRKQNVEIK